MCVRHLSSKQDASHHYKAVCRALATEAGELFTFLDKVAAGKEKLCQTEDEDARRLEELQRADWACLWVQVMRSLRQGVRLKKVEHVHLPPLEYELTPFEMILEDIRSRRYTLTKIMVNGDIPHKVKNDAHAVILNFIRSRPPLKRVDERKLKPKPPSPPDPHELMLREIRARPKLRPIREGKLVVEKPDKLDRSPTEEPGKTVASATGAVKAPVRQVIKPDFNLLLNNSFEESSEDEDLSTNNNSPNSPEYHRYHHQHPLYGNHKLQQQQPHLYPRSDSLTMTPPPRHSWQRAVTQQALLRNPSGDHQNRSARLQRRHTITICEAPTDQQVLALGMPVLQELQEEEEESSPIRDSPGRHGNNSGGGGGKQKPTPAPRTKHSDLDTPSHLVTSTATITLRQNANVQRRSSFEHRRSLTSQNAAGLSSIPEQEDDGKTGGSSSSQEPLAKARSQEQCPPPNPSPPCKGRAKQGLAMVGMKPSGGPYHPRGQHRMGTTATTSTPPPHQQPHPINSSSCPSMSHVSSLAYNMRQSMMSPHVYSNAFVTSSSSPSLPSSSSSSQSSALYRPSPMPRTFRSVSLDPGVSSQSPAYRNTHNNTSLPDDSSMPSEDTPCDDRISRWRTAQQSHPAYPSLSPSPHSTYTPANRNDDLNQTHSSHMMNSYSSPTRRWALNIQEEGYLDGHYQTVENSEPHNANMNYGYYPTSLTEEEARMKHMSLDAGMSMYYEDALRRDDMVDSLPTSPVPLNRDMDSERMLRRTSVGLDRGLKGRTGFRRIKSPEEVERVTRWRDLQEDDLQARLRRQMGDDVSRESEMLADRPLSPAYQHQLRTESYRLRERSQSPAQQHSRRSGLAAVSRSRSIGPESTDVLQQRMANEEARFERWRRLEEGTGSHPLLEHLHSHQECGSPSMNNSRKAYHQHHAGCSVDSGSLETARVEQPHVSAPSQHYSPTPDHEPVHAVMPLQKRWQNPMECLSLTLEEVTHIRSVLTKAELESLISHPDLYQQVSKSKLCFTCKTTRFALFGEWGTKCKFCKRTVCSKCLRKMNVPADHFRNIPVYALSPTPLTQEMQQFIQEYIKGAPAPSVPATREHSPARLEQADKRGGPSMGKLFSSQPPKALHRSQSVQVTGQKGKSSSNASSSATLSSTIKGPVMAICCDCKGMLMEVIRATRASLTLISSEEGRASLVCSTSSQSPQTMSSVSPSGSLNTSAKQYLANKSKLG